MKTENS